MWEACVCRPAWNLSDECPQFLIFDGHFVGPDAEAWEGSEGGTKPVQRSRQTVPRKPSDGPPDHPARRWNTRVRLFPPSFVGPGNGAARTHTNTRTTTSGCRRGRACTKSRDRQNCALCPARHPLGEHLHGAHTASDILVAEGTPLRTACDGVTLWSVWSAPPLPACASLPREGRSPCAHRVHVIP